MASKAPEAHYNGDIEIFYSLQIRIVVLKALTEANESSPVLLHTTDILKRDYNVDPAAAQAADRMMEIVLHTCMQVRS